MGPSADRTGIKWQVLASNPPENYVYTLAHGDVLIVKSDPHELRTATMGQVEASQVTRNAVANSNAQQDPWAEAAARLPKAQGSSQLSNAQIASMESAIEQRVLQKMGQRETDAEMIEADDSRISALESQVSQMQQQQKRMAAQQAGLEQKVEHMGQHLDSHTKQLKSHMDGKLSEQIQRIEALLSKRPRQE